MILFINVFITDQRRTFYDRGYNAPWHDRLDIQKYMLASMSVIKWEHVYLYIKLDDSYAHRRQELDDFIYALYPNAKSFHYRMDHQKDWRRELEPILALPGDDLIWFNCNDDQIFVDYELDLINRIQNDLIELNKKEEHITCCISGLPAYMTYLKSCLSSEQTDVTSRKLSLLGDTTDWFKVRWTDSTDSNQIINKRLLHDWWFKNDYGDQFVPRTDWKHAVPYPEYVTSLLPYRELISHLEGYSNCGLHRNTYPDTIIPKGFFDNQIKISYGFNERIPGYVHINPLIKNYATVDPKGVDYRCVLEDLPLFWKDRISEVKIADNIDENLMLKARNDAMLTLYNETCSSIPRDLLIKKIDISLRKDKNGAIPLSKENEIVYKGDYCTFAHHNLKNQKPNISVICAELSYGTPNNALRSLNTQSLERSKYEIIWTGCISEFVYWRDWARTLPTDVAFTSNQVTNWRHGTYNIHQSLNEAAIAAKSDTLLFCTSTAIFPSRILNVIADYYSKPNNQDSILILPVTPINSEETSKESWRDFIACKKDMWSKLGGFDESSIYNGQAWDLSELVRRAQKLGITINNIDSNEIIFGLDSSLDEPRIPRPANDAIATTTTPSKINRSLLSNQIETIKLDNSLPDNVILLIDDLNDHLITGNISLAQSAMAQLNEFNDISNPILSFLEPLSLGDIASAFDSIIRSLQQSAVKPATLIVTAGILAFSLKLYEQAEQLFIQSINLDQANFHSRLLLTELLESAGKNEFALQLSYDSLRFYPKNQEFMLRVNRLATTSAT